MWICPCNTIRCWHGRLSAVTHVLRLHGEGANTTISKPSRHDNRRHSVERNNSALSSVCISTAARHVTDGAPTRSQTEKPCCTLRQPLTNLKPVCLGVHVANIDSAFVAEKELFTLPVGVDAHVVLVALFVGNERLHDEGVEDTRHNFHLKQEQATSRIWCDVGTPWDPQIISVRAHFRAPTLGRWKYSACVYAVLAPNLRIYAISRLTEEKRSCPNTSPTMSHLVGER